MAQGIIISTILPVKSIISILQTQLERAIDGEYIDQVTLASIITNEYTPLVNIIFTRKIGSHYIDWDNEINQALEDKILSFHNEGQFNILDIKIFSYPYDAIKNKLNCVIRFKSNDEIQTLQLIFS
jgi:hypothetical protein